MPAADKSLWQRAAWSGIALVFAAFYLYSQMPQNGCGGDPTRDPHILFQLARTPQDIATLFGTIFGGPCMAGLQVGFAFANRLDLFLFLPVYGFFLGHIAWILGARGAQSSGALLLGFWTAALVADLSNTLLQLYIGAHLPGTALTSLWLGLMGRAHYVALAAYALACAYILWHDQRLAAPRWLALWIGASGLATLWALVGLLPQNWLMASVGFGWVGLLGLAMAQGFDKDLHKSP